MFRSFDDVVENILPKHNEDEEYQQLQCKFCPRNEFSETELLFHQGVKHEDEVADLLDKKPFYCRICVKDCKNANKLLEHLKVEHLFSSADSFRVQREIFVCDYCGFVFFNRKFLEFHFDIQAHFKVDKYSPIKCPICPKRICVRTIWHHLQIHDIQSVAMCPFCFVKCRNKKQLLEHVKTHPRYLNCEMCLYETKREDNFRQHIIEKHKSNITHMNDKTYDSYFTSQSPAGWKFQKLGSHGIILTNGIRICVMCREICVGESDMKQHICVEHNMKMAEPKPKHLCTCGEIFTTKVLLKHHTFKLKGDHQILE